jgi:hypothetical protein
MVMRLVIFVLPMIVDGASPAGLVTFVSVVEVSLSAKEPLLVFVLRQSASICIKNNCGVSAIVVSDSLAEFALSQAIYAFACHSLWVDAASVVGGDLVHGGFLCCCGVLVDTLQHPQTL